MFKLSGSQTLTADITCDSGDKYLFFGAKPSEIGYLSGATSGIQGQINNITNNYLLSSTAWNTYQPNDDYQIAGNFVT